MRSSVYRDSGYIAIHSGLTVGAEAILIPESDKDFIYLLDKIKNYNSEDAFLIVVSEGDEIGAELVASKIKEINSNVDLRITRLGHVQPILLLWIECLSFGLE